MDVRQVSGRKLRIPAGLAGEHREALSSSGSWGCAFPARRRIPSWVPPRAEVGGVPGLGKLQFPACLATGVPAYGSCRAGEPGGLKRCFCSMGTKPAYLLPDRATGRQVDCGVKFLVPGRASQELRSEPVGGEWAAQMRPPSSLPAALSSPWPSCLALRASGT